MRLERRQTERHIQIEAHKRHKNRRQKQRDRRLRREARWAKNRKAVESAATEEIER